MLAHLNPQPNEIYIDATFGAGGYSEAILNSCGSCMVYGIDRDETAKKFADKLKEKFPQRFFFTQGKFSELNELLGNKTSFDGIVFDLGVSSMQLDSKERGFSFNSDSRLDMRMDQGQRISAYDIVNSSSEAELAEIIFRYGEEKKSRAIAREIIKRRAIKPIETCAELASIARSKYHYSSRSKIDPATKTFQAIRIKVNHELEEIETALSASVSLLKTGGRLVAVSFHSLEDTIVKNFLKPDRDIVKSRYLPDSTVDQSNFSIITKRPIVPSEEELTSNPRARSAKMRVAIKREQHA